MTDQDQEHATVREWTDLLARIRIGTVKVAGKNITGARIKAVAGRLANYADSDGSRVRPGLPRLAVDLETDYSTVKRAVQYLHRLGLLKLVKAGTRAGHADEYQLTIPADLLEHVEVWTPAQHALEMERVRQETRGRYKTRGPQDPGPGNLQVPEGPADADELQVPQGPAEPDLQVPQAPADEATGDQPAGASGTDIGAPAGASGTDLQVPQGPATYQGPRHNYDLPTDGDLRTAVTGPRASSPVEDPDSAEVGEPTPRTTGCPDHGRAFAAGLRPDGKAACPLCRATARRPRSVDLAPVIPLRGA